MPLIKSAIKKLRQDRKKTLNRKVQSNQLKKTIKGLRKSKKIEDLKKAFSVIDKAAKKNIIHKNKASRLKSSLSKLVKNK